MDFDVAEPRRRQFRLRRVQQQARNAEAQLSLNAVARAAGEHAHARAPHGRTGRDGHAVGIDGDARHALAVRQLCARQSGALRKASIEPGPIDDDRFDRDRRVIDGIARRGMKADRPQLIEDAVVGETESLERLGGEHAGAVHWHAARRMFLADRDREAGAGERPAGVQPSRAPADDDDIVNVAHVRRG